MPINMTIMVRSSVGQGGVNASADVIAVQNQLNGHMNSPRVALTVDGACGPKTKAMIVDFQKSVLGLMQPDGRIDPNGRTLAALNDPMSEGKWARMSIPPAPPPMAGGGNLTPIEQQRLAAIQAEISNKPELSQTVQFFAYLAANEVATLKMILNVQGALQYTIEFYRGINNLRAAGFAFQEIGQLFAIGLRGGGVERVSRIVDAMTLIGKASKVATILKTVGSVASALAIISTVVVVVDHFRAGRFGPGFAEAYGTFMGARIPWAGFINAVVSILQALNPEMANNTKFNAAVRFMMAIDPIGAGQTGVDTAGTFIKMAIDALFRGGVQGNELDELVTRMKSSPMRFWVEIGEASGDWMGNKFGDWYYRNFLS